MSRRIYVTHCSAKKNISLKGNHKKVTPDILYTSDRIQRFMRKCDEKSVDWAIFSGKYGVWHSTEKHEWYEKDPDRVSDSKFKELLSNFDNYIAPFNEVWFYNNPGRFHKLYKKLIETSSFKDKIRLFTHLQEIEKKQG